MNSAKPIFDLATHYRIEVQGSVNQEWLQSFYSSAEISVCETKQMQDISVLDVCTDQSGMIGLVRRLHGLGMTILQLWIISNESKAERVQEQP